MNPFYSKWNTKGFSDSNPSLSPCFTPLISKFLIISVNKLPVKVGDVDDGAHAEHEPQREEIMHNLISRCHPSRPPGSSMPFTLLAECIMSSVMFGCLACPHSPVLTRG